MMRRPRAAIVFNSTVTFAACLNYITIFYLPKGDEQCKISFFLFTWMRNYENLPLSEHFCAPPRAICDSEKNETKKLISDHRKSKQNYSFGKRKFLKHRKTDLRRGVRVADNNFYSLPKTMRFSFKSISIDSRIDFYTTFHYFRSCFFSAKVNRSLFRESFAQCKRKEEKQHNRTSLSYSCLRSWFFQAKKTFSFTSLLGRKCQFTFFHSIMKRVSAEKI